MLFFSPSKTYLYCNIDPCIILVVILWVKINIHITRIDLIICQKKKD